MCYDISFEVSNVRCLEDYFPDLVFDDQISINFEMTIHLPSQAFKNHPIIYINREDFKPHCRLMEWSVIPHYESDEHRFKAKRRFWANARTERMVKDPTSYWYKIRKRRCLIPVTGVYEHRGIKGWKNKVPYFIRLKNQPIFFIPGLYAVATLIDKSTGEIEKRYTFTLATREAVCNNVMKQIHNSKEDGEYRMPMFMHFEQAKEWLRDDASDQDLEKMVEFEMPEEELDYWPTDTIRTTKPRADGKRKNEYYDWEGKLPGLGEMNPD